MRTILVVAVLVALVAAGAKKQKAPKEKKVAQEEAIPPQPSIDQVSCPYMREQMLSQMDPIQRADAEYKLCKQNCLVQHHQQQMQQTTEQKVERLRQELAQAEEFLGQMNQAKESEGAQKAHGGFAHADSTHQKPLLRRPSRGQLRPLRRADRRVPAPPTDVLKNVEKGPVAATMDQFPREEHIHDIHPVPKIRGLPVEPIDIVPHQ
ncbi:unnamed protein product, partial [Mesorhabditis spiculigera]